MPITVVGTAGNFANNDADVTVTLPGGLQADDLVVVIGGFSVSATGSPGPTTGGYTSIITGGSSVKASAHYKFMSGSPDTEVVCEGGVLFGFGSAAYVVTVLRDVHTITPLNVAATGVAANSTDPNPPSITTVSNNCMIVVGALSNVFDSSVTVPSGYSNFVQTQVDGTVLDFTAALASFLQTTAGTENPAAFTNWESGDHAVFTIAFDDATAAEVNPRSFGVVMA